MGSREGESVGSGIVCSGERGQPDERSAWAVATACVFDAQLDARQMRVQEHALITYKVRLRGQTSWTGCRLVGGSGLNVQELANPAWARTLATGTEPNVALFAALARPSNIKYPT